MSYRKDSLWGWLFSLPLVAGLTIWVVFPLGVAVVMSLFKWNMISPATFIKKRAAPKGAAHVFLAGRSLLLLFLRHFLLGSFFSHDLGFLLWVSARPHHHRIGDARTG